MSTTAGHTTTAPATLVTPLLDATPPRLAQAAKEALAAARTARDRFVALPADAPLVAVADAFDAIGEPLNRVTGLVGLFFQVHPSAELREAAAGIEQELSRFATDLSLDRA